LPDCAKSGRNVNPRKLLLFSCLRRKSDEPYS
jgi:hypothetical protein